MNRSSSVPNAVSGVPAPAKASRVMSRTCEPTSGSPASDSPRSRPPLTIVSPPAWTDRPASAKLDRNTNNRHTTIDQKATQMSVAKSASISRDRARGSSLHSLIIVRLRPAVGRGRAPRRKPLGRIQLPVDGPQDEPGGLGALAAELLALVLFERLVQVGQIRLEVGGLDEVAVLECLVESRDDRPRIVDRVTLGGDQVADICPRGVRSRSLAGHRHLPKTRLVRSDEPTSIGSAGASTGAAVSAPGSAPIASRRARQSDSRTLIAISSHQRP